MAYLFGGLSCAVAGTLTNGIVVAKTRWQLLNSQRATESGALPRFFPWLLSQMRREGTLRFLMRGVTATWLRELSYSSVRMGLYEHLKRRIDHGGAGGRLVTYPERLACGLVAGGLGAVFSVPCDLARVRMQAGDAARANVAGIWRETLATEGPKGLFRGGGTTVARAALLTATQLATYDRAKVLVAGRTGLPESARLHFLAASLAGLVTVAVTSPLDVLRTRLMRDSAADSVYGGSFARCLSQTVRGEGVVALWRGAQLQWLRIAPHYVITLMTLEWFRKLAGLKPIR